MDLRQLEYFAAVARRRHFGRAAEDLYITQSAVSQQVLRLEEELGLALLRRTPKGVELTPAGAELLKRAERILSDVASARAAMDEQAGSLRGAVRVAAAAGDGMRLAPAIAKFHEEHPGVRLALRQGSLDEVLALVRDGSVDLAVACLRGDEPPGLEVRPLSAEPLVLAVPPDDPLDGTSDVDLGDLRGRPFILTEPGTGLRELVVGAFADVGFSPVPLFELSDPTMVRFLVHAGLGLSVVPASWTTTPGPAVGTARLRSASRHALCLLSREGGLAPAAALLYDHLERSLQDG
jgi:DNA-binding transcriptional LysR family regulator